MSVCETCGHDFMRAVAASERMQERIRHYRRALFIAVGGDRERMREAMSQAETELFGEPDDAAQQEQQK